MFVSMLIALRRASVPAEGVVIVYLWISENGVPVRMLVEPPLPMATPGTDSPPLPKSAEFIGLPVSKSLVRLMNVSSSTDHPGVKEVVLKLGGNVAPNTGGVTKKSRAVTHTVTVCGAPNGRSKKPTLLSKIDGSERDGNAVPEIWMPRRLTFAIELDVLTVFIDPLSSCTEKLMNPANEHVVVATSTAAAVQVFASHTPLLIDRPFAPATSMACSVFWSKGDLTRPANSSLNGFPPPTACGRSLSPGDCDLRVNEYTA
jgi:hypothetical protein